MPPGGQREDTTLVADRLDLIEAGASRLEPTGEQPARRRREPDAPGGVPDHSAREQGGKSGRLSVAAEGEHAEPIQAVARSHPDVLPAIHEDVPHAVVRQAVAVGERHEAPAVVPAQPPAVGPDPYHAVRRDGEARNPLRTLRSGHRDPPKPPAAQLDDCRRGRHPDRAVAGGVEPVHALETGTGRKRDPQEAVSRRAKNGATADREPYVPGGVRHGAAAAVALVGRGGTA